jgi:N6-L-threonylcarbamoyladenine synthase
VKILAIETSCDETAISIIEADGGLEVPRFKVLSHIVSSQIKIHAEWGGVVPNLAKREHEHNLVPLLAEALKEAGLFTEQASSLSNTKRELLEEYLIREKDLRDQFIPFIQTILAPEIDSIAVTAGPGLEPALWVGINFARALSEIWQKPLIPINHMEGHIVSPLLHSSAKVHFPALALLISGGHTELVLIEDWLRYKVIGQTRDDAVGEAFDKVARLLGLPYPGGPQISKLAEGGVLNPDYKLPRPMINSGDYSFSFSGIKTAVLYLVKKLGDLSDEQKSAIAKEFQDSVIEVLLKKTLAAIDEYNIKTLIIGGGVISNTALRMAFSQSLSIERLDTALLIPELNLATDNATMIAMAAYLRTQREQFGIGTKIKADGNLALN